MTHAIAASRRDIDAPPPVGLDGASGSQADWEAPGSRIWLGNVLSAATVKAIATVFAPYGSLTDAAVFPSHVGHLCYGVRFVPRIRQSHVERYQRSLRKADSQRRSALDAL